MVRVLAMMNRVRGGGILELRNDEIVVQVVGGCEE